MFFRHFESVCRRFDSCLVPRVKEQALTLYGVSAYSLLKPIYPILIPHKLKQI